MSRDSTVTAAKRSLLTLLKQQGPMTAQQIGDTLTITRMAAQQHLSALETQGLVAYTDQRGDVGRPKRYWQLSDHPTLRSLFADTHAELAGEWISAVRAVYGEGGVRAVLEARKQDQLQRYRAELKSARGVAAKLRKLASLRSAEGYMAESHVRGKAWVLQENHCPIRTSAEGCEGICNAELDLFRELLGEGFAVTRDAHQLVGDRCCSYRIDRV